MIKTSGELRHGPSGRARAFVARPGEPVAALRRWYRVGLTEAAGSPVPPAPMQAEAA